MLLTELACGCFPAAKRYLIGLQSNQKFLSVLESAESVNQRLQRLLTRKNKLAQEFTEQDISRYFKPNGNPPPITMDYTADANSSGRRGDWKSPASVKQPAQFSLART